MTVFLMIPCGCCGSMFQQTKKKQRYCTVKCSRLETSKISNREAREYERFVKIEVLKAIQIPEHLVSSRARKLFLKDMTGLSLRFITRAINLGDYNAI